MLGLVCALVFGAAEPAAYDVAVYGGTAGGVIAGVAAANEGLKTVVIEPTRHLGGMVSGGLGQTDKGNSNVIGGMSREYFDRVGKVYGKGTTWNFEPHVAEQVFNDWIAEAKVEVRFGRRVESIEKSGGRITALTLDDGSVVAAKVFIDASYEGDTLPRAGISYTWGREGREVYGESLAGRIGFSNYHQFPQPVSPYDAEGKLLPLFQEGEAGAIGSGDSKVQAYNFRLCLTPRKDNQVPFPKPAGYDPARYEILKRFLASAPDTPLKKIWGIGYVPNEKTDVNNNGPVSTDYIGGSWEYPEASYEKRAEIWEDHKRYVQGFLYFLANDPSVPAKLQEEVKGWGLAKDEFVDTDNWPRQLYVREARRMLGEYVMIQRDLQDDRTKPDSIGMGSYNSDSHHVQRIPVADGEPWPGKGPFALNEGDMQVSVKPYEIAYRALLPKRAECTNLLVTGCVSASHVSYSSIRMEPQYMIMGQAAAVAAAQAIREGKAVQDIDIITLQKRLREQKQILSMDDAIDILDAAKLPGVAIDNDKAELTGVWRMSNSVTPFVGLEYAIEEDGPKGVNTARYTPDLPKAGHYEVRVSYTANENRATNAPILINTAEGLVTIKLNQVRPPAEPPFQSLGVFNFEAGRGGYVEIRNEDTDGFVVADAVHWVPRD
ncbi:MAG: FAD-dependent oxidoreductase [FCB group bacterium]|nr:FAD-dependent oxidoreductase [FCB group bacterium]